MCSGSFSRSDADARHDGKAGPHGTDPGMASVGTNEQTDGRQGETAGMTGMDKGMRMCMDATAGRDGLSGLRTVEKDSDDIRRGVRHAHGAFIREMMGRMDETGAKRGQVAAAIGDSPTMSARAFNLNENITLRTMVRNAMALGCDVDIKLVPRR